MKDLLLYIARNLVDDPDAVTVTETASGNQELTLELRVAPDDMGKVIGRQGRIAFVSSSITGKPPSSRARIRSATNRASARWLETGRSSSSRPAGISSRWNSTAQSCRGTKYSAPG